MKKLLVSLMAVSVIALTGCAEKGTATGTENAENTPAATAAVEDGKFDFNSAISNMKICGHNVSLPCAFKELGEGFTFDTPIKDEVNNYMFTTFRYNGTDIGTIYLELRDDEKYEESQIVSMILNSKSEAEINGVTMESSEKDIKNALGEDFNKNDYNIDYGNENDGLVRILMNSVTNTPMSVTIVIPR